MNTRVKIFIVLLSTLMGTALMASSIKGLNVVDNQFGTKVTVFHDQQQPLQFTELNNSDHMYVVELANVGSLESNVPDVLTREVRALDVEKTKNATYRLTFLKQPDVHVTVENDNRYIAFLFSEKPKAQVSLADISVVEDNLLKLTLNSSVQPFFRVMTNGGQAELLIQNASMADVPSEWPVFRHFPDLKAEGKSGNIRLTIESDFDQVMARVKENGNQLSLYVGEALTTAEEMDQVDPAPAADQQATYAFVTRTIEGGEQQYTGEKIGLIDIKDIDIKDLLRYISEFAGLNLIVDESVTGTATYRFKDIPWDQALDIILKDKGLGSELQNGVLRVATNDKFRIEEETRRKLKEEKELAVPTQTITKPLSYAKVKSIEKIIEDSLSQRGKLMTDERTNTLIITDIPDKIPGIIELVETLDRATKQVLIEARVVETKSTFQKEIGIQWGFNGMYDSSMGTQTGMSFPNSIVFGGAVDPTTGVVGGTSGYAVNMPAVNATSAFGLHLGNVLGSFSLDMVLSAMENDGLGRILSRPKVVTQNNKTAQIESGAKIPIQTVQNNTVTVRYINASLLLEVTPQITAEGTIIMDVVVKKEEPDWTRVIDGNPTITTRNASTQVLVRNGGTTVIGGIFQVNDQSQTDRVPGLSRIPLLGWLFKHELQSTENNELLIFITPKIVEI